MRVLVTNDDGVASPGIAVLAGVAVELGHDVVVVAPDEDRSGASASIGPARGGDGIGVSRAELPGVAGVDAYGIDGPPALAVIAALLGGFGDRPDCVVSGINAGPNTGQAVLHSGTVGAALTAANFGLSGLAVSIGLGEPSRLDTAAGAAEGALRWLTTAPAGTVLNVNVPNRPVEELRGTCFAPLAAFGTVQATLVDRDGRLRLEGREPELSADEDSDAARLRAGYVTVTALGGLRAVAADGADDAVAAAIRDASRARGGRSVRP